ncbi:MAG: hypothetical protein HQK51_14620, partial [Oligoflexia bacterium]|nr:hypothetical protein [Oligoflexia bacterium]
MNRYYTIMFIPERGQKVVSFKLPRILLQSLFFIIALITITFSILIYDYKQILNQLYENKYLTIENHKLRGQINIFQMKLNSMGDDLQRIYIFEKKLRIITGIGNAKIKNININNDSDGENEAESEDISKNDRSPLEIPFSENSHNIKDTLKKFENKKDFINLKNLYYNQLVQ